MKRKCLKSSIIIELTNSRPTKSFRRMSHSKQQEHGLLFSLRYDFVYRITLRMENNCKTEG